MPYTMIRKMLLKALLAVIICVTILPGLLGSVEAQTDYRVIPDEGKTLEITGKDLSRPGNALILYTPDFGETTRTNAFGVEVVAVRHKSGKNASGAPESGGSELFTVKSINSTWQCGDHDHACGNSPIPENGVVLSASGNVRRDLLDALSVGESFTIQPQWFQPKPLLAL